MANGVVYEAVHNVHYKLRFSRLYQTMLSSPLSPMELVCGEGLFALLRGGAYTGGFLTIAWAWGLVEPRAAFLVACASLATGLAFAALGLAAAGFVDTARQADVVRFALLCLFLTSGTFFPIDVYPSWLAAVMEANPLYRAVALTRDVWDGSLSHPGLVSLLYAVPVLAVGGAIAVRRIDALYRV